MNSLTPAFRIDPPDWMTSPETQAVMNALKEGSEDKARFVGGCVRNHLLGLKVTDIDIATLWTPDQVMARLTATGIKAVPTGIDYGTVTAVAGGVPFEITTLRKDVETDGRRAVVAFSEDWREDALRRDFTMNTLLAGLDGAIYDPAGQGMADLENRIIRFVGDPAARIAEDYLRILRFFRFHARYGQGAPDAAALSACRAAAQKIKTLSAERISQEWFKILSVENPVDVLESIRENNILLDLFGPEYKNAWMQAFCKLQIHHDLFSMPARLMMLAGLDRAVIDDFRNILLIPKNFLKEIDKLTAALSLPVLANDHAVRVALYKHGPGAAAQCLLIEQVQNRLPSAYMAKALDLIRTWKIPVFPLSGYDLIKLGLNPGPDLGAKLAVVESWWIEQDFVPDKADCLQRLTAT